MLSSSSNIIKGSYGKTRQQQQGQGLSFNKELNEENNVLFIHYACNL